MSVILSILKYYYIINFIHTNLAYYVLRKYYRKITYKEKETGKEISVQEKYAPLVPTDSINYFSFVFFGMVFYPIRNIFFLIIFYTLPLHIKILKLIYKNHETDENQRKKIERAASFWINLYFILNNFTVTKLQLDYKDIYKKYLGEDYDFDQKDFGLYISNHIGYLEIITYMREYGLGLLITYELSRAPGLGKSMLAMGSFFINREDEKSRSNALKILEKRANDFYNKKSFVKTLIFPEGTTTNGQYIAGFKKGAFISLLPVKPLMVKPCEGFVLQTNRYFSFVRTLASFKLKVEFADLPVIKPTEYMFEKYKHLGKEKWEIYANVVNKMYAEIGGFKQCNIRFRDRVLYQKISEDGYYKDE